MLEGNHKLLIKPRYPDKPLIPGNAVVYLDGVEMKNCTRVSFDIGVKSKPHVIIEFYADSVELEGQIDINDVEIKP